jgi:2-oxoglutarate dehydrogenase E1 component
VGDWAEFCGPNEAYLLDLYERYRQDPRAVDARTRAFFETNPPPAATPVASLLESTGLPVAAIVGAVNLAESIRRYGHLAARIDPLGREPQGDPALEPQTHGVTREQLAALPASLVGGPLSGEASSALEAIEALRRIYCSSIGYDYAHIFVPEERVWLREAAEGGRFRPPADPIDPRALLERLTDVEVFEHFLHRTFPGKTRFSLEGLDMLVPVLDEVIAEAAEAGIRHVLIGMAHRGRLNVLAHVLHKPYEDILAEFLDPLARWVFREDMAWSGDVTYHLGAHRALRGGPEVDLTITLPPNPSHLEAIDPVVEGMARAAGTEATGAGAPRFDPAGVVPILIHGDAAFPGQGVVAETLNLARLDGYTTGGTIHIIANNQLGFTTEPRELYSPLYASGLARGFKIPIVHVNADDPEAAVEAARLAFAYRATFGKDFLIDLVGYRRHGHNEGDEPSFTQPVMYRAIGSHPTVRERWARALVERGLIEPGEPDKLYRERMGRLQRVFVSLQEARTRPAPPPEPGPTTAPGEGAEEAATSVPLDHLRALNAGLLQVPEGFTVHRKLVKARERRRHVLDDPDRPTVDWATAEELALASILADGIPIRFTGEDAARGTFSQRHAVLHDAVTGATFTPLQALPQARAAFEIHNTPLTENAVLGFEYGYSVQAPDRLVIWEAQYGDFVNVAQTMIDEFLVSGRAKWGQRCSLVLLLPHGNEGQGPDHASARPERFLQLAADDNFQLANCTTAAQYFHLLRRQARRLQRDPRPLVVLTPKSLLRHPLTASPPRALAEGRWQPVLDDEQAAGRQAAVRRLVLVSGKFYLDLVTSDIRRADPRVAVCRLEQLYPVPHAALAALVARYPHLEELVWAQEEPENMGAWSFLRPWLEQIVAQVPARPAVGLVARPRSATPAEGSAWQHAATQAALVRRALAGSARPEVVGAGERS